MFRSFFYFLFILSFSFTSAVDAADKKLIGLIVPVQHAALQDIEEGFKEELKALPSVAPYEIKVMNAQGDNQLQLALIQDLVKKGCDIFVPIGTAATQMTLQVVKKGCVVALAAKLPDDIQKQNNTVPTTAVLDELSQETQLQFLQGLFPTMKKFTMVYSGSEKVFDEIETIKEGAKKNSILIQPLMAQNMTELAVCASRIDKSSECIFVLKDHLIVSGIHLLIQQAEKLHIPLITSDEGSVREGAAVALGVTEKQIGIQGAKLVYEILKGINPKEIPIASVDTVTIFVNDDACGKQNISQATIDSASKQFGYTITHSTKDSV
jgi:putative tryptophan/tyrosine transport system substrate-binding protein